MSTKFIREQLDRCIELYGQPIDADFSAPIDRTSYEQMRADILILAGIVMGLEEGAPSPPEKSQ